MPGMDGTGPMGLGQLTGRGFGHCGCGMRRGFGRAFGFRRGLGIGYGQVALTKEEERKILEAELKEVEAEKSEIEKRLKEKK
ncbi:MAG TPA: DUF5320 domain-containing protein [Candidatus Nanoarchaeia archaeon]|nr:DUF5320 domain-containing protein [Candidatus Nanoarchaeia archaeon]